LVWWNPVGVVFMPQLLVSHLENVSGRNKQTPRNGAEYGISLYLCVQGRRCRHQTSSFLVPQALEKAFYEEENLWLKAPWRRSSCLKDPVLNMV
jgi:hypothetical protein